MSRNSSKGRLFSSQRRKKHQKHKSYIHIALQELRNCVNRGDNPERFVKQIEAALDATATSNRQIPPQRMERIKKRVEGLVQKIIKEGKKD